MIRVAVVDGHPVARHGVMSMLAEASDIEVVLSVADPAALLVAGSGRVNVVLYDPYPVGAPVSLSTVRELSAQMRVLVMSAARDPGDAVAAIEAGACGYLTKQAGCELLEGAIRSVVAGGVYLSPELSSGRASPAAVPARVLSDREQLALACIARGFTHQQTATRMGVSKATVEHLRRADPDQARSGEQGRTGPGGGSMCRGRGRHFQTVRPAVADRGKLD